MMQFSDKAAAYLASSITAGATSIALQTGGGAKFPSALGNGRVAILKIETPSTGAYELVRATAISADTLTVERNYGGTNQAFDVDAIVSLVASSHVFQGLMARRNRTINGCFRLWDFGTTFSTPATGTLVANNWKVKTSGTVGTFEVSRVASTPGDWEYDAPPKYFLRWNQTVAGTGATLELEQRIEDVRQFAGGKCTVSFLAVAASGTPAVDVYVEQVFGTGGSPSSPVVVASQSRTLSTTLKRYQATFDVPSISGKTIGSDGNDYVRAVVKFPGSSTFDIKVTDVQVERGPIATDFEYRNEAEERQLAARYYWKTFNDDVVPAQSAGATGALTYVCATSGAVTGGAMVRYPVPMRALPNLTYYNPSAANDKWRDVILTADGSAPTPIGASTRGVLLTNTQAAGATAGSSIFAVHMTADANL